MDESPTNDPDDVTEPAPGAPAAPPSPIDDLVAQLKVRVARRRELEEYPPGLEEDLDAHFRRIAAHRQRRSYAHLTEAIDTVDEANDFKLEHIEVDSKVLGGDTVHRLVAKAVARQTQGVLLQVAKYADAVEEALRRIVADIQEPAQHVHIDLHSHIDTVNDRLSAIEREARGPDHVIQALRERIERLEAREQARAIDPWWGNDAFEQAFRGSRDELLAQYRDLAAVFDGCAPVLDIGCGRGEFLHLLAERGTAAEGVEMDPALVDAARADGLDVWLDDGVRYLRGLPDGSLGGVSMIQVIEHLPPQPAVDIVRILADKVRAGGKVVVETVNPQSLYVYAHAFYLDPTHGRPVHPGFLHVLFQQAGVAEVKLDWRSPPPANDVLEPVSTGDDEVDAVANANVERLNQLLFAPQDYAIIATR